MINKTLALLISALILIIAVFTFVNINQESETDAMISGDNTVTDDDIIDELDESLLEEDGEIDIGDMI